MTEECTCTPHHHHSAAAATPAGEGGAEESSAGPACSCELEAANRGLSVLLSGGFGEVWMVDIWEASKCSWKIWTSHRIL